LRVASVTVTVEEALSVPDAAWMIAEPAETVVAKPSGPAVTTAGLEDVHVTELLRSWVVPSLNVPVAVSWCGWPCGSETSAGDTVIETRVASVTPRTAVPVTPS
jgi:hypothetical protein